MTFSVDKKYYDILKIESSATANEIKKAYYKLAKETHPDKNPGSDGEAFKRIQEAYQVLFNEITRQQYDVFLVESQKTFFTSPRNNNTRQQKSSPKAQSFYVPKQKTRQEKEMDETKKRMGRLSLSKEKQAELWEIQQKFSCDATHFQTNKYPVEILKNLLVVFYDIGLSHLDEECRNNPDIVDVSFHHSFEGLRHVSKELIRQLLDCEDSVLFKELKCAGDSPWKATDFLLYYPYDIDTTLFIKLMCISPALVKKLPQKQILAFLRDPQCHLHKENLSVLSLYKPADKYYKKTNNDADNYLEMLFEIYKHFDRNILRNFDTFDSYSQNRAGLRREVKKLFIRYPDEIDLRDILSIYQVVDQESLCFSYDVAQETLACTGQLFVEGSNNLCDFSRTYKVFAQNASWFDQTFICELATYLEPTIFCKMLASIPVEKRAQYLFSHDKYEFNAAYYAYKDRLDRAHYSWDYAEDKRIKIEKTKEHLDALAKLIYPSKPMNDDDLSKVKQQMCASLHEYTAWWKLSFFGHHHEARARYVVQTIENANSLEQMSLIIENQLALLENKVEEPLFQAQNNQFNLHRIFDNQPIDWKIKYRWYNSTPQNLPPQNDIMSSGFYRALKLAEGVAEHNNLEEKLPMQFI